MGTDENRSWGWPVLIWVYLGLSVVVAGPRAIVASTPVAADPANTNQSRQQATVATGYESSRERLRDARDALHQGRSTAAQGLQRQLEKAHQQLEALAGRLEEEARAAGHSTLAAARQVEEDIGLRVRRMEARALLLQAKANTTLAVHAASAHDFMLAEQRLAAATDLLRKARAALVDDHAYDDDLDDMEAALHEASAAVKAQAQDTRKKIEQVLTDTDRIVGSLEVREDNAVLRAR